MSTCLSNPDTIDTPDKRSGGPRTPEGKNASRRNALKHGLRSKIVFPEDVATLVEQRTDDFTAEFAPRSPYEAALVRDMAVSSVRIERCTSLSVADLVRVAERAEHCWEYDRRMSVEDFAAKLSKHPERIAHGLRRTLQGTDYLIERWEILAAIAREVGRWDDEQRWLAFDLLGVPHELRNTTIEVPEGDDATRLIALADAQILKLREHQETILGDVNEADRAMAMAGMPLYEDATTARLRKDESRARTDYAKARNELLRHRAEPSQGKSPSEPLPTSDRAALSNASINHLVERSKCPIYIEEPEPRIERSEISAIPKTAEKHPNRRERKERARRAREAAMSR